MSDQKRIVRSLPAAARLFADEVQSQWRIVMAMILKFAGAGASFAVTFIIAHVYGAKVSGEFALFSQTVVAFSTFAIFGNDHLLIRRIAGSLADGRRDLARHSYSHAMKLVGATAVAWTTLLLLASPMADLVGLASSLLAIAAAGVLFHPFLQVSAAAVRGAHHLVRSQWLLILQPIMMLCLTLVVVSAWTGPPAMGLAAAYNVAVVLAAVLAMLVVCRLMRTWPLAHRKQRDRDGTNSTKIGLTIAIDVACLWSALSLTGALLGLVETGVFRVCIQITTIVAMFVTTYDGMISPRFAKLFRERDYIAAGELHNRSTAFLLLAGGVPLVFILIFAEPLLGLMGDEFRTGATPLRILAVGQIAAMAAGGAGAMITMNGREAYHLKLAIISFVVVIALMLLLTPTLGINGPAIALSAMWAIRYVGSYVYARRMVASAL